MRVEKNWSLSSPSREQVVMAEPAMKELMPFVAWGYRGDKPAEKLDGIPKGVCMVSEKGIAFLTWEVKKPAERDLTGETEELTQEELREILDYPGCFVIPYIDIVQTEYAKVGSFWKGKHEYVIITTEEEQGKFDTFCITPCDKEFPGVLMACRFGYEKVATLPMILDELIDFLAKQKEFVDACLAKYGKDARQHLEESTSQLEEYVRTALAAKGLSEEKVNTMVHDRLRHFKVIPELAECFSP